MFGFDDSPPEGAVSDVQYINWLLMARAGLTGLEFYTPETGQWRQAHMQARYVILQVTTHLGRQMFHGQPTWSLSCWRAANLPTKASGIHPAVNCSLLLLLLPY